jgi:hypothetical protein
VIVFPLEGTPTTAAIVAGAWVHGLPAVVVMLESIVSASDPDALAIAAERLGGEVLGGDA